MKFLDELKRRRVFRAAATYAIVGWILLQVGEVTFEPLHLPDWALTTLIVAVIAGFPVVLIVSWFFDLTRRGLRKHDDSSAPQSEAASAAIAGPDAASVAVLPFEDMSAEKDQEYLCDGIAEEILNRLSQIDNLKVASRTSSFRFKGQASDIGHIGRELNVRHVLEGSVRKAGKRLRITTQLIHVGNGYHLWSHSYDREIADIFSIEDDIATEVANALRCTLGGQSFPDTTTADARAYDFFLKGLYFFRRWGLRNVLFAIEMFDKAVETDPAYARGWAALAECHAMICMYWRAADDHLEAARSASEKALELAPDLGEAHVSRGLAHSVFCEHDKAVAEFERALVLDPDLFEASYFYARVLFQSGDMEHAAEMFERAQKARPEDFQSPILLRQIYSALGREDEAVRAAERGIELARRHLEMNPDDTRALNLGLGALAQLGMHDLARDWAERSLNIDGHNPDTLYNVACGYALMGDSDRALECLEKAGLRGMLIAEWAENDADLASLHDDPRFHALMERLKQHC